MLRITSSWVVKNFEFDVNAQDQIQIEPVTGIKVISSLPKSFWTTFDAIHPEYYLQLQQRLLTRHFKAQRHQMWLQMWL